jgi:ATP-dependent RNA helicase SUPV3L1/SUV3
MASIRTWTYISNRTRWVQGAEGWQEATRDIEDRLSDALHDRLVQRFVERSRGGKIRRSGGRARSVPEGNSDAAGGWLASEPPSVEASHPFAKLAKLRARLSPAPLPPTPASSASVEGARWVEQVVASPHEALSIDARGRISLGDKPLGRLARGARLSLPDVTLLGMSELGAGGRSRLSRRLVAFARDLVSDLLAPLRAVPARELSPVGQELLYQLELGLGTCVFPRGTSDRLTTVDRGLLGAAGLVIGERVAYAPSLLEPPAIALRAALAAAWLGLDHAPEPPGPGAASIEPSPRIEPASYTLIGFPVFGTRGLRADVADRVHRALGALPEAQRPGLELLATWMGCPERDVPWIADELGAA